MKTPKDVDSYIAAAPKEVRATLIELRRVIKKRSAKCFGAHQLRHAVL